MSAEALCGFDRLCLQIQIKLGLIRGSVHIAVKILVHHRDRAVDKVSYRVGKIDVIPVYDSLIGYRAVRREGHLAEKIVSRRVDSEPRDKIVGVNNIAL